MWSPSGLRTESLQKGRLEWASKLKVGKEFTHTGGMTQSGESEPKGVGNGDLASGYMSPNRMRSKRESIQRSSLAWVTSAHGK